MVLSKEDMERFIADTSQLLKRSPQENATDTNSTTGGDAVTTAPVATKALETTTSVVAVEATTPSTTTTTIIPETTVETANTTVDPATTTTSAAPTETQAALPLISTDCILLQETFQNVFPQNVSCCEIIEHVECDESLANVVSLNMANHEYSDNALPERIFELASLKKLNLSNSNLNGEVSHQLNNLQNLKSLDLSNNNFHGHILNHISEHSLDYLEDIRIQNNQFTGQVVVPLRPTLHNMFINNNNFSGLFPDLSQSALQTCDFENLGNRVCKDDNTSYPPACLPLAGVNGTVGLVDGGLSQCTSGETIFEDGEGGDESPTEHNTPNGTSLGTWIVMVLTFLCIGGLAYFVVVKYRKAVRKNVRRHRFARMAAGAADF